MGISRLALQPAMSNMVNSGVLRGRPFGGVAALINVNLRSVCTTIASSERYCVIKFAACVIINVYMPCLKLNSFLSVSLSKPVK